MDGQITYICPDDCDYNFRQDGCTCFYIYELLDEGVNFVYKGEYKDCPFYRSTVEK